MRVTIARPDAATMSGGIDADSLGRGVLTRRARLTALTGGSSGVETADERFPFPGGRWVAKEPT